MFKNILRFLFEEEEDEIIEDQPLVDISMPQDTEPKPQVEKPKRMREKQKSATVVVEKPTEAERKPVEVRTVVVEPTDDDAKPKNRFINIDEPQATTSRTSSFTMKSDGKRDYEVSPVISPIFGTKEDQNARSSMSADDPVVRTKKKNPLGTIISPMFGAGELEEMEDKAQARLSKGKRKVEIIEEEIPSTMQKETLGVPLADLIASEDDDTSDDVMQFSLFGGEEAINQSDAAKVHALDEDE